MLKIKFDNDLYQVEITPDTRLSDLVTRAGIMLDLRCAGFGVCGCCRVELISGDFVVDGVNVSIKPKNQQTALACHTEVRGTAAEISVPPESVIRADGQIAVDYEHIPTPQKKICIQEKFSRPQDFCAVDNDLSEIDKKGNTHYSLAALKELGQAFADGNATAWRAILADTPRWVAGVRKQSFLPLGVAIDIGTTSVAAVLIDLDNNEPLASVSAYNRQSVCGDNVASRISYASTPAGLDKLHRLIVDETINPLLRRLFDETGMKPADVLKISVAGNTVMTHLFLGVSPQSIGTLPFLPAMREFPDISAGETALAVNPAAQVKTVPAIAGYIGGDITAGIIASGQYRDTGCSLLVDIGTNCEIVLSHNGKLHAAAAAAGPAFEGAGIACGSRAAAGAIDRIDIDAEMQFSLTTIEHAPPVGLCGSAIIDFLAEGFSCGLINEFGRYNLEMLRDSDRYFEVNYGNGPIHACVIVHRPDGKAIYVSEADIEQVLKAKAAAYAGIQTLLEQCAISHADLDTVYLAGGFARYLRQENAITLGMLPPLGENIYRKIGNSSLAGAVMNLNDPDFPELAAAEINRPQMIELNTIPGFEDHYIDALMIPNFNPIEAP